MIATFTLHATGQKVSAELKEIEKNIIKPCDDLSYHLIVWGLTKQEAEYVVKNKEGFIDRRWLLLAKKEIKKLSENFKCLLRISESDVVFEIKVQEYYETIQGKFTFEPIYYSDGLDEDYENYKNVIMKDFPDKVVSKEMYKKQQEDMGFTYEKMWGGVSAITLYAYKEGAFGITTNGTDQVVINKTYLNIKERKEALQHMTATFAHEAYGHLYFKLLGKWHSHGAIKSLTDNNPKNNKELEIQIKNREDEASNNFIMHVDTYAKFLQ
ncbi:hypothetical protein ACF3OE_12120 [Capnocytophaga canis]|uniref:Uncharacterized protein n=1 Tax=Capnocytophaga canis TaxID=1848903 RepID=A0A3A1YB02_9FLAO|nr:hypothetical protein [Capnocytophaga canis]RIY34845.1 hypothetical protein CKY20_11655 [Capnocytophaga canis]